MIQSLPQVRIMQNGNGWYWEVFNQDREVVARGIAQTHAQACADANKAAPSDVKSWLA